MQWHQTNNYLNGGIIKSIILILSMKMYHLLFIPHNKKRKLEMILQRIKHSKIIVNLRELLTELLNALAPYIELFSGINYTHSIKRVVFEQ